MQKYNSTGKTILLCVLLERILECALFRVGMYHCNYCCFCCIDKITFIKHRFQAHSFESTFSYKCEISSCNHLFTSGSSYASFLTHCNRNHDKWREFLSAYVSLGEINGPGPSGEPLVNEDHSSDETVTLSNASDIVVDPLNYEDLMEVEHCNTPEMDIERSVGQFLLIFKEKYRLTQAALNFALSSLTDIIKLTTKNIEQSVQRQLVEIDPSIDSLSQCFTFSDPFINLRTEYQQNKFYRDNLGLIVSNFI